jgi:hypothetical protein
MAAPAPRCITLDVSALPPDVVTIDALARLELAARRGGLRFRLHDASDQLRDLIAFVGLTDVLRVEPRRQAEQGEERVGIEEERELDDPAV